MSSRWGMTSSVSRGPMEQISNERYQEKAALRQASYTRKKASVTQEKGLIIVHTGPGKGKTTAALSIPIRPVSRPNGVWSFNMTPARLRGGYGSRDCEDTRAYH